ncbi:hypothetical protein AAVH_08579 [Aphelenchoides avenae]|nr:hypothetical protein AAVH_08579 [Aphelenchus avenae]
MPSDSDEAPLVVVKDAQECRERTKAENDRPYLAHQNAGVHTEELQRRNRWAITAFLILAIIALAVFIHSHYSASFSWNAHTAAYE